MATAKPALRARVYPGLDGLRALAVVAVLCYHALPATPNAGYLGVDVFFVLSGFLITSLLIDQANMHQFSLMDFWHRRLRRIVPAVIALVLGLSMVAVWLDPEVLHGFRRQVLGSLTFSFNWLAIAQGSSYFDQFQPELLRNLWSLAVEMQFYLVWPLLLMPLLRAMPKAVVSLFIWAGAAGSVVWAVHLYVPGQDPTRIYYGTDTHSFGLLLGAGLACFVASSRGWRRRGAWPINHQVNKWLTIIGTTALVGIGLMIYLLDDTRPGVYPWALLGASVLACVVVLAASATGSWLGKVLDFAPLRWVGQRSYGVYLWHWPVAIIASSALPKAWFGDAKTHDWVTLLVSLVVSIVVAAVSYRWIETPVRQRGWRAFFGPVEPARTIRSMVLGASLVALTICLAVAPAKPESQLIIEQSEQIMDNIPPGYSVPSSPVQLDWPPRPSGPASSVKPMPSGKDIVAIGDSVMLGCAPDLDEQFPGILIDAQVSRSYIAGLNIIQTMAQRQALRQVILVGLFTNGPVSAQQLDRLFNTVSPGTTIVLVTGHADRSWIPPTNQVLHQYAAEHPGSVLLADWDAEVAPHPTWLASDGVHPKSDGRDLYVQTIVDALRQKYKG